MAPDLSVHPRVCPSVESAFALLGKKWAGLIIHVLAPGPMHFSELERAIPAVSARMLSERVKDLERAGIVSRTVFTRTPIRVIYQLSDMGKELVPVMQGLERWAHTWKPDTQPDDKAAS
jgi:DNA-binding HxlR family transcriptional regulator